MMTSRGGDTAFILTVLAIVVPLLALLPVARHADEVLDRQRPMYDDLVHVEWLEYQALRDTGSAVEIDVEGEAVAIGDAEFQPSDGVRIVVEVPAPEQFCVQVSNSFGDSSARSCFDPADPPRDPDRSQSVQPAA
ncbi:hypothetical protein GCM10009623_17940 [Nocardioides aestuarii]|uniref:Uncharacterized protein n=1 Tax=Nocardioides aestuarii TaxID=252231 RepID=A0ABW4TMK6_9ACTN